jgi:ribosomal protein L21
MLLVTTKEVAIGKNIVTLYSIDSGKTWISRPKDIQLFKLRRRQDEQKVKELVSAHVPNDLEP